MQKTRKERVFPSVPVSTLAFSLRVPGRLGRLISKLQKPQSECFFFFTLLLNCIKQHLHKLIIHIITVTLNKCGRYVSNPGVCTADFHGFPGVQV